MFQPKQEKQQQKKPRELVKFYSTNESTNTTNELLNECNDDGAYNQFTENEKRFNVKSTYDFNKYTTTINEKALTEE